jgi:hypothetical protein
MRQILVAREAGILKRLVELFHIIPPCARFIRVVFCLGKDKRKIINTR